MKTKMKKHGKDLSKSQNPALPIHGVMPHFYSVLSLFDGFLFGIDCGSSYICAWKN